MSAETKVSLKELLAAERAGAVAGEHPTDPGYAPPVDLVSLPSGGKVYPPESPLYMLDSIEIKAMTARDEDILTSRALIKKGIVLTTLMRSCITNRTIDPDQLLVGDRNAIIVKIRVSAYGAEYNVSVECPQCEESFDNAFDMSRLPLKSLSAEPIQIGTNAFRFTLPSSGREAIFKLLTGADATELERTSERLRKAKGAGAPEENVTTRLHAQCVSLGGETDRTKLAQMIRNMPARDSRAWRRYMDEIAPGVDMTQSIVCPACGKESEVDVPLGTEFFWPSR